jgi:hypothetical protein
MHWAFVCQFRLCPFSRLPGPVQSLATVASTMYTTLLDQLYTKAVFHETMCPAFETDWREKYEMHKKITNIKNAQKIIQIL